MSNTQGTKPAEHPTIRGRVLTGKAAFQAWKVDESQKIAKAAEGQLHTPAPEAAQG